jgi:DNA polymerase/3'-5' exonuclease PolX
MARLCHRKAANILKSLTYKVESREDALKLRGIGTSIAEKIGEIISTGKLRKLDILQSEEQIQVLSTFMGIFDVGQSTANKWCAMGYKTLEDIEKHATLTYAQAVGLKFYHDFKLRIPRDEMEAICGAVKKVIHQLDPNFIVEICGSYRRGKADCGDIDIIITHKRASTLKNVLHLAIPLLHEARILTHDFVTISEGSDKYMGVCQANSNRKHRRIDMLTVPPAEWPFALLYFTGSGHFNRSMRFWAGKRGYSLSQHGLRVNYGNDNKGPYIAGITTEKQVFEALGLEYRPPEDRDV